MGHFCEQKPNNHTKARDNSEAATTIWGGASLDLPFVVVVLPRSLFVGWLADQLGKLHRLLVLQGTKKRDESCRGREERACQLCAMQES